MDLPRGPPASHNSDVPILYENTSNPSTSSHAHQAHSSNVLFREIHKNAWLRRLPNVDKRSNISNKKNEKVWTVFCIHDDIHPFLEFYPDQESAMGHKPQWYVCLSAILHISPTIIAQDQECEFVVTLPSDIVRLAAPSWDAMMDWVEAIRSKLTEMKVLSPQENVYSRMPEARPPLLPTRDPNSPLPPPPMGPSALVPGVEPIQMESAVVAAAAETFEVATRSAPACASSVSAPVDTAATAPVLERRPTSSSPERSDASASLTPTNNPVGPSTQRTYSRQNSQSSAGSPAGTRNASDGSGQQPVCDSINIFNFNFVRDSLPHEGARVTTAGAGRAHTVVSSSTPGARPRPTASPQIPSPSPISPPPRFWHHISQAVTNVMSARMEPVRPAVPRASSAAATGSDSGTGTATGTGTGSGSGSDLEVSSSVSIYEQVFPNTADLLPEETRHRPLLPQLSSPASGQVPLLEVPRRRRRTSSGSEQVSSQRTRAQNTGQNRPMAAAAAAAALAAAEAERRLQPAPHPFRHVANNTEVMGSSAARVTLREQQVVQLRREMLHAGGVRMQLRRKDCVNSIALVEAFGAVWIAGWKQREYPMLYNALHIGDQLISAAGTPITSASEAQRVIRSCADSLYVELIVRRVPFGRVFALKREVEGQVVGINLEGGSGEIRDVVAHSPAARAGLSSKAPTCDGLSLTSWVLTEVNGRPLNLFFKDGEVRDRLNAVGTEISILVQPLDLVKQIRKQLRTIRGYKDYIVQ